jgi:Ca2+-binding RTX toxin-like protein
VNRSAALIAALSTLSFPAAAGAASLRTADDGRLVYQAGRGERNDVTARDDFGGSGPRLVFGDLGARVRVGPGCADEPPIVCEMRSTDMRLGDRRDRGNLRVDALRAARLWGELGDDSLTASGGEAFAAGGVGDDGVTVSAHGAAVADGGAGRDTLSAFATGFAVLRGDEGPDRLTAGAATVTADGGAGPDVIDGQVGFGAGRMLGGAGDDRLGAAGDGSWRIDAGSGQDLIVATTAGVDTIVCGPGRDSVQAGSEDVVAADCETVARPA